MIGPAVLELAALAEVGEGAAMGLRIAKIATEAAVGTASTIGANLAVYGSDYSLAMLKADLLGGMGGSIGPAMIGPYAKALTAKLGPKLSAEIVQFAETVAGIETGAWAQGESGDLSPDALIKAAAMGKVSTAATKKIQGGLAIGEFAPGRGGGESDTTATKPPAETPHLEQPASTNGDGKPATLASETQTTKPPASTLPLVAPEQVPGGGRGGGAGGNGSGGGGGAAGGGGDHPFAGLSSAEIEAAVNAPGHSDLLISAPAPGAPRHPSDASVAEIEAAINSGARQAEGRGTVEGQPANLSGDFGNLSAGEQAALLSENPGVVRPRAAPPAGGGARIPNPNDPLGMGVWEITTSAQSGRPGETRDVPTTIRVHTADPSPGLPPGSNTATGNTVSVTQGNQSETGTGVRMVPGVDAEGAGVPTWHPTAGATDDVMNASHIPIHRDPPQGGGGAPDTAPTAPTTGGAPEVVPDVVKSLPPEPDVSALGNDRQPKCQRCRHLAKSPRTQARRKERFTSMLTRTIRSTHSSSTSSTCRRPTSRGRADIQPGSGSVGGRPGRSRQSRDGRRDFRNSAGRSTTRFSRAIVTAVGVAGQTAEPSAAERQRRRRRDRRRAIEQASRRCGNGLARHRYRGPGGKPDRTWVMHSAETGLWTVDFPDAGEFGGRGKKSFASIDEYHEWFKERFGVSADVSAGASGAPALHSPEGGQDIADVLHELTGGTATGSRSSSDPELLNTEQLAHVPWEPPPERRQRLRNQRREKIASDGSMSVFNAHRFRDRSARCRGSDTESSARRRSGCGVRPGATGSTRTRRSFGRRTVVASGKTRGSAPPASYHPHARSQRSPRPATRAATTCIAVADSINSRKSRSREIRSWRRLSPHRISWLSLTCWTQSFRTWFDMTTQAAWKQHFFDYSPTHGWPSFSEGRFPGHIDTRRR